MKPLLRPVLMSGLVLLHASVSLADPEVAAAPSTSPARPWGIEVEALQPFIPNVNVFRMHVTRTVWGKPGGLRGDVLVGFTLRPNVKHDVLAFMNEYQLTLSYRQYLWRGLHIETGIDAGIAWGTNLFDGEFYRTATLFLNRGIGYRFGFFEPGGFFQDKQLPFGFFITPQFGVLNSLGVANYGPRNGKPNWFLTGSLFLGVSF
ncbi:MAG: hypothetical protein INH41_31085 [Myxococcaceae bacterium]|nr:hypothetical protein [Myxococcaceae bacterium]